MIRKSPAPRRRSSSEPSGVATRSSVCQGCATGCNAWLDFDPRYNKVERYRPRENEAVNKFWMCDEGRRTYRHNRDVNRVAAGAHANLTYVSGSGHHTNCKSAVGS